MFKFGKRIPDGPKNLDPDQFVSVTMRDISFKVTEIRRGVFTSEAFMDGKWRNVGSKVGDDHVRDQPYLIDPTENRNGVYAYLNELAHEWETSEDAIVACHEAIEYYIDSAKFPRIVRHGQFTLIRKGE